MHWSFCESLDLVGEYAKAFKIDSNTESHGDNVELKDQGGRKNDAEIQNKSKPPNSALDLAVESIDENTESHGDSVKPKDQGGDRITQDDECKNNAEVQNEDKPNFALHENNCESKGDSPNAEAKDQVEFNVLIFGCNDPGHIMKTLAKHCTQSPDCRPKLNFYVICGFVELMARNLALLGIALERPELLNLRNKVHLFMDVYGNSLLRPTSNQYLIGKSKTLIKMITDNSVLGEVAPFIRIDQLKYRERDFLENALTFWQPDKGHVYDIQKYWSQRVQKLLGARYDYRDGVFDWDLNMTLKDRNAKQICSQEYRYWRETGVAFTYPEYEQCKPNKTFASAIIRNGSTFSHCGYPGDIQTGPFCSFGLACKDERMLSSMHGENDYRATDITERNLLEYFYEIQTGTRYVHDPNWSRKYGAVRLQMGELLQHNELYGQNVKNYEEPWININGIEINFLSLDEILEMQKPNNRWLSSFDIAFVSHNYFPFVKDSSFAEVLKAKSLLIMETKLFTLCTKEAVNEFEMNLKQFAKNQGFENVINYQALNTKNSVLKFKKNINQK